MAYWVILSNSIIEQKKIILLFSDINCNSAFEFWKKPDSEIPDLSLLDYEIVSKRNERKD